MYMTAPSIQTEYWSFSKTYFFIHIDYAPLLKNVSLFY